MSGRFPEVGGQDAGRAPGQDPIRVGGQPPFAVPAERRDPARRLRGRLVAPVTVWTAGHPPGGAGLTVSSVLVAEGQPARLLGLLDRGRLRRAGRGRDRAAGAARPGGSAGLPAWTLPVGARAWGGRLKVVAC